MDFDNSNRAIYLQIAEKIMDQIISGQYTADARIPSVRDYAASMEVNANTVQRSFTLLEQQNIIYNKRGIGYFVDADAATKIIDMRRKEFYATEMDKIFQRMHSIGITPEYLAELYMNYLSTINTSDKI